MTPKPHTLTALDVYHAVFCLACAFAIGLMIGCGIGWSAVP